MPKTLSTLLRSAGAPVLEVRGNPETAITGLVDDSRHVKPGDLFAALEGLATDGHAYVGAAVAAGATAVLHEKPLESYEPSVAYLRVPDARALLSALSRGFYGDPSRELVVIGVTGTKGKSTTTWFTAQLLEGLGKRCGFVSSASTRIGGSAGASCGIAKKASLRPLVSPGKAWPRKKSSPTSTPSRVTSSPT